MDIYQINTGYIKMKSKFYLFPGLTNVTRYPVFVFLIKIKNRYLLFDTGLSKENLEIGIFNRFVILENISDHYLSKQLKTVGIKKGDIDYIINSHLHFDHSSGNHLFKDMKFLIQKEEISAFEIDKKNPMYQSSQKLDEKNIIQIEGNYDIFKDKTSYLMPAPGHSQGQQILIINHNDNFLMFLADACYSKENNLYPIEVSSMSNYNTSFQTVNEINKIINSNKNVTLFFSHQDNTVNKEKNSVEKISSSIYKYSFK